MEEREKVKAKVIKHLQRAKHSLNSSKILLESEEFADSISRSYYAAYHAAMSLMTLIGSSPRTHKGLVFEIYQNYVEQGLVQEDFVKKLQLLLNYRSDADYGIILSMFSKEEAEKALELATELLDVAQEIVNDYSR